MRTPFLPTGLSRLHINSSYLNIKLIKFCLHLRCYLDGGPYEFIFIAFEK